MSILQLMREYFAVDASKVTPPPDNIFFDDGGKIEPLDVTVHAAKKSKN